jgi:hypothetical protein
VIGIQTQYRWTVLTAMEDTFCDFYFLTMVVMCQGGERIYSV